MNTIPKPPGIKQSWIDLLYCHLLIHAEYIHIYAGYIPTQ